jgi:hypothetical protein
MNGLGAVGDVAIKGNAPKGLTEHAEKGNAVDQGYKQHIAKYIKLFYSFPHWISY